MKADESSENLLQGRGQGMGTQLVPASHLIFSISQYILNRSMQSDAGDGGGTNSQSGPTTLLGPVLRQ